MAGMDLRADVTALQPTKMTRNEVKDVGFNFPAGYDLAGLAQWSCDVERYPKRPGALFQWSIAIDPGDPLRVVVTYDATGLLGNYEYQMRDENGVTLWGPYRLVVAPDVSAAP